MEGFTWRENGVPSQACCRLASLNTMKGQFPRSSSVTFFRPSAQCFAISLPTLVCGCQSPTSTIEIMGITIEPVKVTFLRSSCLQRVSLSEGVFASMAWRTLKPPFSNPACSARYASESALRGVPGDGLIIIIQSAANAALAFLRTMQNPVKLKMSYSDAFFLQWWGVRHNVRKWKFQGTEAQGCFIVTMRLSGVEAVNVVPRIPSASPATNVRSSPHIRSLPALQQMVYPSHNRGSWLDRLFSP